MTAKPGLPPAWPRRRRVAGYARGSASGGAVPIPIRAGRAGELCRDLLARSRALPQLRVMHGDGDFAATIALARHPDAPGIAHVTRSSDLVVRLPPDVIAGLRAAGWIAAETGQAARVHGPRTAAERDIAWRIMLVAIECAAAVPAAGAQPARADLIGHAATPALLPVETVAAI